jgi:hypothetical protein
MSERASAARAHAPTQLLPRPAKDRRLSAGGLHPTQLWSLPQLLAAHADRGREEKVDGSLTAREGGRARAVADVVFWPSGRGTGPANTPRQYGQEGNLRGGRIQNIPTRTSAGLSSLRLGCALRTNFDQCRGLQPKNVPPASVLVVSCHAPAVC